MIEAAAAMWASPLVKLACALVLAAIIIEFIIEFKQGRK